eukprot:Hpha_TRINITY_DN15011_c4_g2::TRINITY_DN15011_c4_g2_i1::g.126404::m.126404
MVSKGRAHCHSGSLHHPKVLWPQCLQTVRWSEVNLDTTVGGGAVHLPGRAVELSAALQPVRHHSSTRHQPVPPAPSPALLHRADVFGPQGLLTDGTSEVHFNPAVLLPHHNTLSSVKLGGFQPMRLNAAASPNTATRATSTAPRHSAHAAHTAHTAHVHEHTVHSTSAHSSHSSHSSHTAHTAHHLAQHFRQVDRHAAATPVGPEHELCSTTTTTTKGGRSARPVRPCFESGLSVVVVGRALVAVAEDLIRVLRLFELSLVASRAVGVEVPCGLVVRLFDSRIRGIRRHAKQVVELGLTHHLCC